MTDAGLGNIHSIIVSPLGLLAPPDVGISVFKSVGTGLELQAVRAVAPGVARVAQVLV